jgi:hypothetical protein
LVGDKLAKKKRSPKAADANVASVDIAEQMKVVDTQTSDIFAAEKNEIPQSPASPQQAAGIGYTGEGIF